MPRELRPRKARPSYAALAGVDIDDQASEAGPSQLPRIIEDQGSSGSDFAPEKDKDVIMASDADDVDEEDEDKDEDEYEGSLAAGLEKEDVEHELVQHPTGLATSSTKKLQTPGKSGAKAKVTQRVVKSLPAPSRSVLGGPKRQVHALPTPSVNHRHRAVPLFSRAGRIERLAARPYLFEPSATTLTNSFTQNPKITDRVTKAWGYNVGAGPLWEMTEDRGWYKESSMENCERDREALRRPVVYRHVSVMEGWSFLNKDDAARYLPTDIVTTDEGNLKPPPPLQCFFGPFDAQTKLEVQMFETHHMSEFFKESNSHIIHAGAPVWGLDWCPIHIDERQARSFKQYLAVAPFPSASHSPEIGAKVRRPAYACIQIWSLAPTMPVSQTRQSGKAKAASLDPGIMKCELVLCLESGPVYELKWCPLPTHDSLKDEKRPRKLGLIAGTFEDGSLSIYAVPDPSDLIPKDHDLSQPVYVRIPDPVIRIELKETCCWTFDWANSELIAIGTTNGIIAVYDVGPSLKAYTDSAAATITNLLPTHYITVHQSAIRALAWIRVPPCWPSGAPRVEEDPTVIASGGYDGMECLTDIREGRGSVMNRTRDVISAMAFSTFGGGPITIDHENTVKAYSASPSMLGRGHTLLEPQGPIWSIATSDLHPQLAVGSADGSCCTTNTLRSTRRGGSVPFFVYKIYQMDYSRKTGEYRMLEKFLPQETHERPPATRTTQAKTKEDSKYNPPSTGAWPQQVGVHRVVWNSCNGLGSASLLASATASGLCRVDMLWGRWIKDKIPYGGIEHIRRELDEDIDVDSDESVAST